MRSYRLSARRTRALLTMVMAAALLVACGDDEDDTASADVTTVEDTVRASIAAENEKDVDAFLNLWTDKGLEAYDVGSRDELKSGKSQIGEDRTEIVELSGTKVTGDMATTTADVALSESSVAKPVFRTMLTLVKQGDKWLIDGFEFVGSPPLASGATIVDVKAQEYAFIVAPVETAGNFAFKLTNTGKEAHELTLFKAPDGVDLATAKAALENVDGSELNNVPSGYQVDHIGFTPPGESVDISFAEPLSSGTYVLACYIPEGGFTEEEEPVNPQGRPHIQVGMINMLKVT